MLENFRLKFSTCFHVLSKINIYDHGLFSLTVIFLSVLKDNVVHGLVAYYSFKFGPKKSAKFP